MKLWEFYGTSSFENSPEVLFRDTNDYGLMNGRIIEFSENWYVWKIGDESFVFVGKLLGNNQNAEIGIVINPLSIVNRMKTGNYDFVYPSFEIN